MGRHVAENLAECEETEMSDVWTSYVATVTCHGETRTLPVQALSVHEVSDNARVMAGFEFGWAPAEVSVLRYELDAEGTSGDTHIHTFEVHVRPEGGQPEVFRLKARDAESAEGLAVLHSADRLGIDPRAVDVLSVSRV
jgi:hypothetical protein